MEQLKCRPLEIKIELKILKFILKKIIQNKINTYNITNYV